MRPYERLAPADYRLFLQAMREDRCIEYPLVGWEDIAQWFYRMQFTIRPLKAAAMREWRKRFAMPVTHSARTSKRGKPWTTNLMLQAWLGSQGRALSLPRSHPFRIANEVPIERKPRYIDNPRPATLRTRRRRERLRGVLGKTAAALAAEVAHRRLTAEAEASHATADTGRSARAAVPASRTPA